MTACVLRDGRHPDDRRGGRKRRKDDGAGVKRRGRALTERLKRRVVEARSGIGSLFARASYQVIRLQLCMEQDVNCPDCCMCGCFSSRRVGDQFWVFSVATTHGRVEKRNGMAPMDAASPWRARGAVRRGFKCRDEARAL